MRELTMDEINLVSGGNGIAQAMLAGGVEGAVAGGAVAAVSGGALFEAIGVGFIAGALAGGGSYMVYKYL